jgi:hypothetical protein
VTTNEEFKAFPSIPRLFRDIIVTEKIDGTNAQITITPDDRVLVGSRSRLITPEDDNFGFAKWVKANEEELRVGLGYGTHYGEWYGRGIQRGYGLADKRFALFNVSRWSDDAVRPKCCDVVPTLYVGKFDTTQIIAVASVLATQGSKIAPGFMKPEGVVVFHTKAGHLYKYTFEKNDGHKSA